mmetsp:Transcript_9964/g.18894  ORF Transcript_9964/g.18894 Transcript_9964/m.18894 type:complete len:205 (-) Transcript_9964:1556-2170(-)
MFNAFLNSAIFFSASAICESFSNSSWHLLSKIRLNSVAFLELSFASSNDACGPMSRFLSSSDSSLLVVQKNCPSFSSIETKSQVCFAFVSTITLHKSAYNSPNFGSVSALSKITAIVSFNISTLDILTSVICFDNFSKFSMVSLLRIPFTFLIVSSWSSAGALRFHAFSETWIGCTTKPPGRRCWSLPLFCQLPPALPILRELP